MITSGFPEPLASAPWAWEALVSQTCRAVSIITTMLSTSSSGLKVPWYQVHCAGGTTLQVAVAETQNRKDWSSVLRRAHPVLSLALLGFP